jgi:TonB-dependent receptor
MSSLRKTVARGFYAAVLATVGALRSYAGDVVGVVSDATDSGTLAGAVVTIVETGRSTTTDANGRFAITGLPAGTYTVSVRFLSYETKNQAVNVPATGAVPVNVQLGGDVVQLDAFRVEGYREGRARALQQKQNQINISDIISADAIGNLPDRNVAEAVARLPGVNISLEQGEGRYVSIRGVEPNLNQVMIDGAIAAAPGGTRLGRAVPLDTLGAGQVSHIEVVKSVTPDLDANSLGGTLKITTASPFDRRGRFFSTSAVGTYNETTDKRNLEARVSFSDLYADRTWGVGATFSIDQRDYANHWVQSTWNERVIGGQTVFLPNALEIKPESGSRDRWGGNFNIEWRPDESLQMYFRPNYSRMLRKEKRVEVLLNVDTAPARVNLTSPTTGTFLAAGYRPERRDYDSRREQDLFSVAAGFKKVFGDFTLEPMLTFSRAKEDRVFDRVLAFRPASGVSGPVQFDIGRFDFNRFDVDYTVDVPANYQLRRTRDDWGLVEEDTGTAKVDLTWNTDTVFNRRSQLRAGFKYTQRDRVTDFESRRLVPVGNWRLNQIGVLPGVPVYGDRFHSGFHINHDATWDFVRANPALTRPDEVDSAANSIEDDYNIDEYIYAGFAMGNATFGKLTLLGGLRWEKTDATIRAVEARFAGNTFLGHFPASGSTSYDKLFPNAQAVYRFHERMVARAAITRTIGRPAYEDARPLANFRYEPLGDAALNPAFPNVGTLSVGNPDLGPYDSMNYDVSLEWYAQGRGVISIAAFRKDVDDPIYGFSELRQNVVHNGIALERLNVSTQLNADSGRISGIEFTVYQPFTFLPAPFDGFGIDANFTKITSKLSIPTRPGEDLPFFRQPGEIVNVTLFYERGRISGRLAWTRSDEQLYTLATDVIRDIYRRPREQYDLQLRYKFGDRYAVTGSVRNLTRQKEQFSYGIRHLMRTSRLLDRDYKLGVEFRY